MPSQKSGVTPPDKTNNYRPSDKEPFMNERQREYFRQKLLTWKEEILKEAKETLAHLQAENENHPDLADRASSETERTIELRARDRQRKLIARSIQRSRGSMTGPTATARRPASRLHSGGWRRGRLQPFQWRHRSATSAASAFTATNSP
jgi:hypothetical protein